VRACKVDGVCHLIHLGTMSLISWINPRRSLSPILKTRSFEHVVLGVIGTRSTTSDLRESILPAIMEAWSPDEIILPADGETSYAIHRWADSMCIPVRRIGCEWGRHGSKAGAMRDALIQKEATHLLLLQGPRSNALSQMAARLKKKGRPVAISERPGLPVKDM